MKRTFVLVAACMALSVLASRPAAAQPAQPPKPGPEHQRLGYFVGKWTSEGEMKPGPMGPGGKITSTDTCEWFEGRYTVMCRYDGTGPMGPSKGIGFLGYSPEDKVYTYYGIDNRPMAMTSIPRGTVKGNVWTYTDESPMGGKPVKSRVTLTEEATP